MANESTTLTCDDLAIRAREQLLQLDISKASQGSIWDLIDRVLLCMSTADSLELLKTPDLRWNSTEAYAMRMDSMIRYLSSGPVNVPSEEGFIRTMVGARVMLLVRRDDQVASFLADEHVRIDENGCLATAGLRG